MGNDMDLETLKRKMDEAHYIYDDTLITVLYVALRLNRPLLIEGAAGVGKTEIAKVMADMTKLQDRHDKLVDKLKDLQEQKRRL